MATVDIVVPCYNYGRYLSQCVNSVLSQAGVDVNILILDDHSSDDTAEIGRALSDADPRVRFRRHAVNQGHIATYNEGLAEATADYVVLLSADDLLTPGALLRATALMDVHPNVGLVYGYPIALYGDALPPPRTGATSRTVWEGSRWIELVCRAGKNFIHCPEVVMRTRVQHAIGGYDPALPHSGDLEMWIRAALVSDVGRINGADQAYYRVHSQSMQRTTFAGALNDLKGRRDAFDSAFQRAGASRVEVARLREHAYRSIARDAIRWGRRSARPGAPSSDAIGDYRALAVALYPGIVGTRGWRALDHAERGRRTMFGPVFERGGAYVERCMKHLEWRRWQRTGVF